MAKIKAVCISEKKGTTKKEVNYINLIENEGIENDAHRGLKNRQVSFLADEKIESMRNKGVDIFNGIFAENIVTEGVELEKLPLGTILKIGDCEFEVTQIGKTCHHDCEVFRRIGTCIMPKYGIFCNVIKGGKIQKDDNIEIIYK
jgi:MOSC domain-containing protein YiiM